ncbi:MAG: hypothetical protein KDC46_14325 [Thermoleophilia bacterium]|nr:hypothetical protein [Thermoleophilia bacterium]
MRERLIKDVDGGYVVFTEQDRRVSAYLSEGSAERAATRSLELLGGGTIIRVDGTKVQVTAPEHEPAAAGS